MTDDILRSDEEKRRFSLVGGFLGAGKTTLIGKFTQWLQKQGLRVALVTNDQGQVVRTLMVFLDEKVKYENS